MIVLPICNILYELAIENSSDNIIEFVSLSCTSNETVEMVFALPRHLLGSSLSHIRSDRL